MKSLKTRFILDKIQISAIILICGVLSFFRINIVSADINLDPPPSGNIHFENEGRVAQSLADLLTIGQYTINGLIGIGILLSFVGFVKTAFALAKDGHKDRAEAMNNLIILAGTTAGLGAFPLVLRFIVLMLQGNF